VDVDNTRGDRDHVAHEVACVGDDEGILLKTKTPPHERSHALKERRMGPYRQPLHKRRVKAICAKFWEKLADEVWMIKSSIVMRVREYIEHGRMHAFRAAKLHQAVMDDCDTHR